MVDYRVALLVCLSFFVSSAMAIGIEVRTDSAKLKLTNQDSLEYYKVYPKGNYTLDTDIVKVCNENSDILINKRSLSHNRCRDIEPAGSTFMETVKDFFVANAQSVCASSTRDSTTPPVELDLQIDYNSTNLIFKSSSYSSSDVILKVYENAHLIGGVDKYNKNENLILPKVFLKEGYVVKVIKKSPEKVLYIYTLKLKGKKE